MTELKRVLDSILLLPHVIINLIDSYYVYEPYDLVYEFETSDSDIHIIDDKLYYVIYSDGYKYYYDMLNPKSTCIKYKSYVNVISFTHNVVVNCMGHVHNDNYITDTKYGYELIINNKPTQSFLSVHLQDSAIVSFRLYKSILYFGIRVYYASDKMNVYALDLQTMLCTFLVTMPSELLFVSDKYLYMCVNNVLYKYDIEYGTITTIDGIDIIYSMSDQYIVSTNNIKNVLEIRSIDQPTEAYTLNIQTYKYFNNNMFYLTRKNNDKYEVSVYKLH